VRKIILVIILIILSACSQYTVNITYDKVSTNIKGITLPPKWTETITPTFISNSPISSYVLLPTINTIYTHTLGPTPTIVPEEQCPNFPLDQLPSNFSTLADPSILIGKHFEPGEGEEYLNLATELDILIHYLVIYKIETGNLVWIERFICWDSYGIAYFEVKDAIIMRPLSSDQSISLDCWSEEQPILYPLAVGSVNLQKEPIAYGDSYGWIFDRLDYGYVIDTSQEKIIPVSTTGWTCMHPMGPCDDC
jgi:hypothetical protein